MTTKTSRTETSVISFVFTEQLKFDYRLYVFLPVKLFINFVIEVVFAKLKTICGELYNNIHYGTAVINMNLLCWMLTRSLNNNECFYAPL